MSVGTAIALNPATEKAVIEHGQRLLEQFHSAYESDPVGRETEFRRGQFIGWRHLLNAIFGSRVAQNLTEEVSDLAGLTIPHAGPLADHGQGYIGWDSGCHAFVGKLE